MKNTNPKISVIVPVYNVEKYLCRCIDSILSQSFKDFELLLVDDGSTDRSGAICDEYVKKDLRVRVFHKENGGVSSARQFGIEKSVGEYSIHVDSDDWIEKDMFNDMYSEALSTGSDIVTADYYDGNQYKKELYPHTVELAVKEMLSGKIRGVMWNKFVRHSLYADCNIKFPVGINFCEDVYVCVNLFLQTNKIKHIDRAYYHYLDNPNSITRKLTKPIILQRVKFVSEMSNVLSQYEIDANVLFWHKVDLKWLIFDSPCFSYNEYKSAFNDIFKQYSYKSYPHYFKNICILYLVSFHWGWTILRRMRKIK